LTSGVEEKLRTWKGRDREGQKQLAEHLGFAQLKIKVKYEVFMNVSVCNYSEVKSIFVHIYITTGFSPV